MKKLIAGGFVGLIFATAVAPPPLHTPAATDAPASSRPGILTRGS